MLLKGFGEEHKITKQEEEAFEAFVEAEKKRITEARARKKKSIVRKISFIDDKMTQKEREQDQHELNEVKKAERKRISKIRSKRRAALYKMNWKPLTAIISSFVILISSVVGVSYFKNQEFEHTQYDKAVDFIHHDRFEEAIECLDGVQVDDAQDLQEFCNVTLALSDGDGKPQEYLARLEGIEEIIDPDINAEKKLSKRQRKKPQRRKLDQA